MEIMQCAKCEKYKPQFQFYFEYICRRCSLSIRLNKRKGLFIIPHESKFVALFKKYDSIHITGRDNPREKVRRRDHHTCQICFQIWEYDERKFDVHHKSMEKEKTRGYQNYEEEKDNMITLCHKCHFGLHYNKKSYQQLT